MTLESADVAYFPDAPTKRGVKHLKELTRCIQDGFEAHVVFVVKMHGIRHFSPNYATHPAFGKALVHAESAGVKITALHCLVTPDSLTINGMLPMKLVPECPGVIS